MNLSRILAMMKKYYKVLFSTALISALGFSLVIILSNSSMSMDTSLNSYVKEFDYPQLEIKTSPATIDKIAFLDEIKGIADHSEQFIFDTIMRSNDKYYSIRAITYDESDFQKSYVWKKRDLKKDNVVSLEYSFAVENNIQIGDKIDIKIQDEYKEVYVDKLVSLPETFAMSVVGDTWTLSFDFGYVYVSRDLLAKESSEIKQNTEDDLEGKLKELEAKEESMRNTYGSITQEFEKTKTTINQKQTDFKSSESELNKKLKDLTKTRDELLNASQTASSNRQKLVSAQKDLKALKKELENNKEQLTSIQSALSQINSSLSTIRANRAIITDPKTVLLIKVLRKLPGDMTVKDLKTIANYAVTVVEDNPEVEIPVNVDETPLNKIYTLDETAEEIMDRYNFLKSINISDVVNDLRDGKYSDYVDLLDLINDYTGIADLNKIQEGYDSTFDKLQTYANYIEAYQNLNLSSYLSDSGVTVPISELVSGFSSYAAVTNSLKEFFNFNDATTVRELLNMYDEANTKSLTALNSLQKEKNNILNKLHENNINENEINNNIVLISNQIVQCDNELKNIEEAIKSIDNASGDVEANLKQVSDGLSKIQKELNTGKSTLYSASNTVTAKESMYLSEWLNATKEINSAKAEIEQAIVDVNNQYDYDDYFNRIVIKYTANADHDQVIKDIKDRLLENGIEVLRTVPYENSLVKQRIDNNIEPIRKMSFFLPTIFFIIILNVVFLFINLIIKQCRRELGILKSLGYTTKKIRGLFYTLSSFVYLLAVIIGTIIGYYMTRGIVIYYNKFFYLPLPKYSYNTKMYFIALIALYVVIELATALATLSIKKLDVQEVISNYNPDYDLEPDIFNNLKLAPMLKYNILTLFRNLKRFIFCCICISSSIIMIFTSISAMQSARYFQTELFDKRINYDAEIYFYDNVTDELAEDLQKLSYVDKVEVVSYYHTDIEANGKKVDTSINLVDKNTDMIRISDKKGKKIPIEDEGIIIDYITAKRLGVKKGDTVKIEDSFFKVNGISYQNIQYIQYLSNKEIDKFKTNDVKVIRINYNEESKQKLINYLQEKDNYVYTLFTSGFKDMIIREFSIVDLVCYIIIGFSAIMGFIIILNTNITNLIEQKKKLCILKSMGYDDKAISLNWFSQTIIQLVASCIIGFPIGIIITIKSLKYVSSIHENYVFLNGLSTYLITLVLVISYLAISHLVCMRKMKKWDVADEIKTRD